MTRATVLLIDDNLFFLDKLKHQVEAAGFAPKSAMFSAAVDSALDSRLPAAVVVNLEADRMDALAIIADLRAHQGLASTPIVAFAGHVKPELLQQGQEAGATRVVTNGQIASGLAQMLQELCAEQP